MLNKLKNSLDMLSRILLLIILFAALSIIRPGSFLTLSNLTTVIFQQAPFTILMSFGMGMAIITKGIDKSMASVMIFSTVMSSNYFKNEQYLTGFLIAMAIGVGCGFLNGFIITHVGVAPFIATFGIDFVASGLAYVVYTGTYVYAFPDSFRFLTNGYLIPGIPNVALITIITYFILWFVTKKCIFGRGMYSAGFNFEATRLSGSSAKSIVTMVYCINGALAALTGILYMARLNAADPGSSGSLTLDSMAAALIGGISFGGGKGSVTNAVIGALIIVFIRNGMNLMNISINWQQVVIGAVIIISIFHESFINKIKIHMVNLEMKKLKA
ncbi:ABC transporter permease [Lachnospiraceae bacterium 54-53]